MGDKIQLLNMDEQSHQRVTKTSAWHWQVQPAAGNQIPTASHTALETYLRQHKQARRVK